MRIIDAHVHLSPPSALGKGEERLGSRLERNGWRAAGDGGFPAMPPYLTDSCFPAEALVALMDACGVEAAVIQQTPLAPQNEETARAVERYPDRLSGAMLLEPREGWREEMEYWHGRGLRSVKLEMRSLTEKTMYPGLKYTNGRMLALFARAGELGLTVTVDPAPTDYAVYDPEDLREALEACPRTRFVLCHLAYPRPMDSAEGREKWERMAALAGLPNCWLDVSAMPDFFGEEGWPYPTALELLSRVRDMVGIRKLLWGSDIPGTLCSAAYPQMIEMFRRGDLTPAEQEALFCRNAPEAYRLPAGKGNA